MSELLSMVGVTKSYPGSKALKDGRIEVGTSEIHALIGANGAGKSTMMNVLYGILPLDGGSISFCGKNTVFRNVSEAQEAGIFMIHQELNVAKDLTVAQNMFLGREPMKGLLIDDERMIRESIRLLADVGLDIDPREKMENLSPAEQQLVEIAALKSREVKLIILDEPTTALGEKDVKTLFGLMRKFKEQGISMIFISHRLDELFEISDKITVMRNGRFVISCNTSELTRQQLVYYMTGKEVGLRIKEKSNVPEDAPTVLEVHDLSTEQYLHDINFCLRKGEILGFAGLMGSGRTSVARAVCGIDKASGGTITINSETVRISSPVDAIKHGMGYLSENRNEEGMIIGKNIIFNTAVSSFDRYTSGLKVDDEKMWDDGVRFNEKVGTVASTYSKNIENISGGNRQKVIIARALMKNLQILILDEPTRGIDVGAKEEIYSIIETLAQEGHSIILISSETEEIQALCDRVIVMYEGTQAGELQAGDVTPERIMYYATGGKDNGDER